jgi:hypothetical protein
MPLSRREVTGDVVVSAKRQLGKLELVSVIAYCTGELSRIEAVVAVELHDNAPPLVVIRENSVSVQHGQM